MYVCHKTQRGKQLGLRLIGETVVALPAQLTAPHLPFERDVRDALRAQSPRTATDDNLGGTAQGQGQGHTQKRIDLRLPLPLPRVVSVALGPSGGSSLFLPHSVAGSKTAADEHHTFHRHFSFEPMPLGLLDHELPVQTCVVFNDSQQHLEYRLDLSALAEVCLCAVLFVVACSCVCSHLIV